MKLGKIKRITDLRSIWPHEANDFTKWLADEHNLAKSFDVSDQKQWATAYAWYLENAIKFNLIAKSIDK